MARRLILAALFVALPASWAADGEALIDPTRPPVAVDAAPPGAAEGGMPVLQTVILGKGRKPTAIISGQRVELKGRFGDARMTRLSETEAVLDGPQGRQVLKLTPEAEKRQPPVALTTRRAAARRSTSPQP